MEQKPDIVSSYVTEVADIQTKIKTITKEIPNASKDRHLELQRELQQCINRLEEIKKAMVEKLKEKERVEVVKSLEQRKLTEYLDDVQDDYWLAIDKYSGKIRNGKIVNTQVSDMDYSALSRLEINRDRFGEVEFVEQQGQVPDFETTEPLILDMSGMQERAGYLSWRISNIGKTVSKDSLADIFNYIKDTYSEDFYLPGLDYWKFILEKQKNDPKSNLLIYFNTSKEIFFPGTLFWNFDGYLCSPKLKINANNSNFLFPDANSLFYDPDSPACIVLLPKNKGY